MVCVPKHVVCALCVPPRLSHSELSTGDVSTFIVYDPFNLNAVR